MWHREWPVVRSCKDGNNPWGSINWGNFLILSGTVSLLRGVVIHSVSCSVKLMMILFIWPQEMFSLCSGEVTLSTYHFMALDTVWTRVVAAVLGSCSISVFVCPFVGLAGCIGPGMSLAPHLCTVVPYTILSSFNSIRDSWGYEEVPMLRCSLIRCNWKHRALDIRYFHHMTPHSVCYIMIKFQ